MGTPLERREREKHEMRAKILQAARELFTTEGYEAVTMRRIAERIEYSATAIYRHFEDKQSLLLELCRVDFSSFAGRFVKLASVKDPVERLRRLSWDYLHFAKEHPQEYRLMFMTPRPAFPDPGAEAGDPTRNPLVFWRTTIDEAIRARRFHPSRQDADLIAQTMWAALHGVASLEIVLGWEVGWVPWKSYEERARCVIDVLLTGLTEAPRKASSSTKRKAAPR